MPELLRSSLARYVGSVDLPSARTNGGLFSVFCNLPDSRHSRTNGRLLLGVFCKLPADSSPSREDGSISQRKSLDPQQLKAENGRAFPSWHQASTQELLELLLGIPDWADAQKERGMSSRRAFYTNEDWLRHRSCERHARHLLSSLSSRVIISLIPPVFTVTAISIALVIYNSLVIAGWLPSFMPLLHAPSLPYELTAPALALLLVFRTDASYSRYDEARKTWTKVISSTKDLARQSTAWINNPKDRILKNELLQYVMAFPVALKCYLIHGSDFTEDLKNLLDEEDLAFVLRSKHRPNCILQLIFQSIEQVELDDSQRSLLDANITNFNDSISICERLVRTPIPLSYTRLTSRFLVVWHLTLPIVLWDECNWLVIPATFFSAAALFCIEEVGVLIEEPFPILPLDRMCTAAHNNIRELVQLQSSTRQYFQNKYSVQKAGAHNGAGR
ncbi:hypothetical protein O6H91_11G079700 [Diphasiastrum complanatum]|uniref:Uncharacterized protein n=3 Tax=Diphasiastrum complanatum TaxID=34168 RepID=A0ACC2CAY8_DIPCM|nr:hypothetical protein O6H91_11G079700 [Diphasiastrum complanatum]KAJ7539178.1 hypothetical protein O6H91_11G079700 [Diphasiastrum complanatum]KAJ7539179.1 hypothetical protein O6H91_11G079700 [Diphasiastrum complanatum]